MTKYMIILSIIFPLLFGPTWAASERKISQKRCSPVNIQYCPKKGGSTLFGGRYTTYQVRCSDGTQRRITHWRKNKKWCVEMDKRCSNGQLKAAKQACLY